MPFSITQKLTYTVPRCQRGPRHLFVISEPLIEMVSADGLHR
jgi:hypothetical protein